MVTVSLCYVKDGIGGRSSGGGLWAEISLIPWRVSNVIEKNRKLAVGNGY